MEVSTHDDDAAGGVRCPTCHARQEWSDTCRRCKCDLRLLRSVVEAGREARRRCLLLLRAGRVTEALRQARRGDALCSDRRSARLLAVCYLLCGNWVKAAVLARVAAAERSDPGKRSSQAEIVQVQCSVGIQPEREKLQTPDGP